jgi:uncharacterized cupin superfamily protein
MSTTSGTISGTLTGLVANLAPRLSAKLLGGNGHTPGVQRFSTDELPSLAGAGTGAPPVAAPGAGPSARTLSRIKSQDGYFVSGLWDCTAGTLEITFDFDELVHILEGEVTVRADGAEQLLLPGSVAFFPNGLVTTWEIPRYLRKMYVHRYPHHSLPWRVARRLIRVVR